MVEVKKKVVRVRSYVRTYVNPWNKSEKKKIKVSGYVRKNQWETIKKLIELGKKVLEEEKKKENK